MRLYPILLLAFIFTSFRCPAAESLDSLLHALEIAEYWDRKQNEWFPITYNHLLSTGYFTTPSARMTKDGLFGVGVANIPPYLNLNARLQPFCTLELSLNYRTFKGVEDPNLSPYGFGDYADRTANFKMALITPEASYYALPGFAFGVEDFMGSKKFTNFFVVGTQVFPNYGVEISAGWGFGRYTHGPSRGFFGGFNWFPFQSSENKWIKGVCLSGEYDPIDYKSPKKEPNPHGRESKTPLNFGIKYNFEELGEFSLACVRGSRLACSASFHFDLSAPNGFIPKLKDPPLYCAPKDFEPISLIRPESVLGQQLTYAFEEQGFQLTAAWIEETACGETALVLRVMNCRYRQETNTRTRLQYLLASLTPSNVDIVTVLVESYGVDCQKYVYPRGLLLRFANHCIGPFEFDLLTPREEAALPAACSSHLIFKRRYDPWKIRLSPRLENFFGSANGKYKYDLGIKADVEGFLKWGWYYELQASYTIFANIHGIKDFDLFSPSQLLNVATDYIRYRQENALSLDRFYLQKSMNWSGGIFSRFAIGYFQVNYGGVAGELLWYPACSNVAFGLEGAIVKKRAYSGLGFQKRIRKMKGFTPTYKSYFLLDQVFFSFYWDIPQFCVFTKTSVGQFLAKDFGVRFEATRYFSNGIRLTGWMTYTNANDRMHGQNYYDRGIGVEIPFDLFFRCSSRRVWNQGMAAWLRDAGYATSTGKSLFEIINRERRP